MHEQASITTLTEANDLLSVDSKQNFKNLFTRNTYSTYEIASIVAGMNSQREADGHTHHILHLTEQPYFMRIPVEGEGGRSWSKANDSDGRKTCYVVMSFTIVTS
jgi:hypothetical protein